MVNKKKSKKSSKDVLNSKIKKISYTFNVRKKFKNSRNLKVKKNYVSESEGFSLFGKKTKKTSKTSAKFPIKIVFIGLILLLLIFGGYFIISSLSSSPQTQEKEPINPYLKFTIFEKDTDIVSYGKDNEVVGYFLVDYQVDDANSLEAKLDLYTDLDSKTVYLLKSDKYEPRSSEFTNFKNELKDKLIKEGYTFNEKTKEELFNLPESSIILIPTGNIPKDLIIGENTIVDLVEKKNIVIYIGRPFNEALEYDGTLISLEQNPLNFSFTFNEDLRSDDKLISSGINLKNPGYKVDYLRIEPKIIFGAISSFKIGEGFILFVPQYLDEGWINGTVAAEDINKIISESSWHNPISSKEIELEPVQNTISLFSDPFTGSVKYAKIQFIAKGDNEGLKKQIEISEMEKKTLGEISVNVWPIHPHKVTKNNMYMAIAFKEKEQANINPNMLIYSGNKLIKSKDLGGAFTNTIISRSFSPDFEPGNYLIIIEEGKEYAKYLLDIKDILVAQTGKADFKKGNFNFKVVDEQGNQVRYAQATVMIDGKEITSFDTGEQIKIEGYQGLSGGNHTFTFDFGSGFIREIEIPNPIVNVWDPIIENPINIALLIITIIAVVIAFYVKRPEKQLFSLDIPNFPPISTIKVPMKTSKVLEIFEKVNKDYSWKFMPLTLEELKTGFSKVSMRGKKIIIGEYNLELLLDKLIARELVKEKYHYYILNSWEEKSGKGVDYLVMFRRLRDMFLEHVVKFTDLNKAKNCDVCIEVNGEKIFLHIFSDVISVFKTLKTVNKGQTIILFDSQHQIEDFKDNLASSNPTVISFKLELSNGSIFLYTLEELRSFIETAKVK